MISRMGFGVQLIWLSMGIVSAMAAAHDNLWELVLSSTTLSQSQFDQLYQESYHKLDQQQYSTLLQHYLADLRAEDFGQAQIDLVRLSAGTIFNISADYLPQVLQAAENPWGEGPFWTSSNSEPWEFQIKHFLINQFVNLYVRLGLRRGYHA